MTTRLTTAAAVLCDLLGGSIHRWLRSKQGASPNGGVACHHHAVVSALERLSLENIINITLWRSLLLISTTPTISAPSPMQV